MQNASGFATQRDGEFDLEIYLQPRDMPYLVVASSTLDTFGSEFTIGIECPVELKVTEG